METALYFFLTWDSNHSLAPSTYKTVNLHPGCTLKICAYDGWNVLVLMKLPPPAEQMFPAFHKLIFKFKLIDKNLRVWNETKF